MYLKYNLPRIINDTPELVLEKIVTHNLRGFAYYLNKILTKISKDMYNIWLLHMSVKYTVIRNRILICTYMDRWKEMLYVFFIVT